jgi:hypothetical protein
MDLNTCDHKIKVYVFFSQKWLIKMLICCTKKDVRFDSYLKYTSSVVKLFEKNKIKN